MPDDNSNSVRSCKVESVVYYMFCLNKLHIWSVFVSICTIQSRKDQKYQSCKCHVTIT